ncbi:hypothetical protein TGP89_263810A [Toxoplasma gondii p89]|uniref:Uncharacterized protein n=2 Tax=Toxoplasma gondii TaxID=5811 RepID=A0A086L6T8_TOXGO|nr:hypothetical protein TGP89_263810A [Toxoplasma gondii p89]KFG52356.1 hypothetical protein TGFOU_404270 [Toxoplasma gondii FOU]
MRSAGSSAACVCSVRAIGVELLLLSSRRNAIQNPLPSLSKFLSSLSPNWIPPLRCIRTPLCVFFSCLSPLRHPSFFRVAFLPPSVFSPSLTFFCFHCQPAWRTRRSSAKCRLFPRRNWIC